MKCSLIIQDDRTQVVLEPETEYERSVIGIVKSYKGEITQHHGVEVFETEGGWTRTRQNPSNVVLVLHRLAHEGSGGK